MASATEVLPQGSLDIRRKGQIAFARPSDHKDEVRVARQADFDLNRTIFGSVNGALPRAAIINRLDIEIFWSDAAVARIEHAFSSIPAAPSHDRGLLEFMRDDCNFSMEHADGSFMDHLQFCYEYSAANFAGQSPRVLLLHSIMGVGTNYFPMEVAKEPKLRNLVTETEMQHIEAFPSVLRLLLHGGLLDELADSSASRLGDLQGLACHRVIDNGKIYLPADVFWVQLNYQLIHLLDFLPVANWAQRLDDTFLAAFMPLHALLVRAGKLMAHIDFSLTDVGQPSRAAQPPLSLGAVIDRILPSPLKRRLGRKAIADFSAAIGHSLRYELEWTPTARM
eukprot:TRINITY_DN72237_c0_g1_i1.p1 TRINITY_DN72237_c0_g1~~TRINITY_DN72237_c0_g1_i1.p1  ORF type:complete len:337 (-),score=69.18 TRINITY_DN72237_c0_g1_i1:53-1063(-)